MGAFFITLIGFLVRTIVGEILAVAFEFDELLLNGVYFYQTLKN